MTAATTQAQAATTKTPNRTTRAARTICLKRTRNRWADVPAPWGSADPVKWLEAQPKRLVFNSHSEEYASDNPQLVVYAVGSLHPNAPPEALVCELSGAEFKTGEAGWFFLCEWPDLPGLVAEYAPLLKFHQ